MDSLLRDLRYALRTLRKTPGFTFFAVLTLALGIGAASTIFSVVNTVLLSPLPYRDPGSIVAIYEANPKDGVDAFPVAPANFMDWQRDNRVFSAIGASRNRPLNLTASGAEPERIPAAQVTAGYFTALGVAPRLGRAFTAEEDAPGGGHAAILSDALWRRRFSADPKVVGQTITLNDQPYTVVGVAPASMRLPSTQTELWVPMAFSAEEAANRGNHSMSVVARLRPGVTLEQARAEMRAIAQRIAATYPALQKGFTTNVRPLSEDIVGDARTPLFVLAGAVGFVLLICCANVANLMLARAAGRQKEIAIRSAIGAGRRHIVRQLLAESVVLAILGGGVGLLLSTWGVDLLVALGPRELPRLDELAVDGRVAAFAITVSMLTGLVFGVAPALHASRADLNETLKDGTKGSSGGPARARARQALLVAEVAISLTLLVGAGLMLRSMSRLRDVDPGFETANLLTGVVSLPATKYDTPEKRVAFFDAVGERLRAAPGVERVAFVANLPLSGSVSMSGYWIEGKTPVGDNTKVPVASSYVVTADYFRTMEIPLARGRLFTAQDRAGTPYVAIINETLARQQFGAEDPVGKRIQFDPDSGAYYEIVGVVGDVLHRGLGEDAPPQLYITYAQNPFGGLTAVVRGASATALTNALRGAVREVDADLPVARIRSMEELIAEGIARPRFITLLLGTFAGVALVLAVVGIYGVVAYSVAQRTQEFGIRMALGADARRVLGEVVGQATRVTAVGVAIGVAAALVMSRGLTSLLFQVNAADPLTYGAIVGVLLVVTVVASWVPARRATRVSPMAALRPE
ncbi:MAG TPA: ABC transporter permease [Gemmatimonadaceae bacterium]|nr:ABC transporter permease [Gemmatimonadaceae bacterium]